MTWVTPATARLGILISAIVAISGALIIPVRAISAELPDCSGSVWLAGGSGNSAESSCRVAKLNVTDKFSQGDVPERIASFGPKLRYRVTYSQLCSLEDVRLMRCVALSEPPCPSGAYLTTRSVVAINGPRQGQIVSFQSYCDVEPEITVPGAEDDIARITPERFREFPIAASEIASQPDGFSLRNGHAHMYASSETQDFNITLFDQDVRVRAIPMSYVWSYGDGSSRTLDFPGEPRPNHNFEDQTPSSHLYKETGDFTVGMSTRFRGEYSTEGGPWTPIPGVATVPSESMVMSVWRTKKLLVSTDCVSNPSGPGCDSPFGE